MRTSKTLWGLHNYLAVGCLASAKLQPKVIRMRSADEVRGSVAYDNAPLLRVHLCVSRAFLVLLLITFRLYHGCSLYLNMCFHSYLQLWKNKKQVNQVGGNGRKFSFSACIFNLYCISLFYASAVIYVRCYVPCLFCCCLSRFGSFQICKGSDRETGHEGPSAGQPHIISQLADYVIRNFYPQVRKLVLR